MDPGAGAGVGAVPRGALPRPLFSQPPQSALLQLSRFTSQNNTLNQTERGKIEEGRERFVEVPNRCLESGTHPQQRLGLDTLSGEKRKDMNPLKPRLWDPHTQLQ